MSEVKGKISQANGRLKAANLGVQIQQLGDRLYLRATLPPKPGSGKTTPYQQRISLGVRANPSGVKSAEAEARKVGGLLACGEFDWSVYQKVDILPQGCGDLIGRFESHYLAADGLPRTWQIDYYSVLKRLPDDQSLTSDLLTELILKTAPNTKTRKRACMATKALAKFAGIDFNPSPLAGSYGPSKVNPRDLPDDETIARWQQKIANPGWRWVYGMMACYGLRPHECFRLHLEDFSIASPIVAVDENTKTGARRVWPCYPEWVEEFDLTRAQLPKVDKTRTNDRVGKTVSKAFYNYQIPFKPYDLRHCWAIRTLEFGLDISLAAQQMGHSVQVHTAQYHHWITDRHHQRAFEALMIRSDRPRPPVISP